MMFDVYTVSQILAGNKDVTRRMATSRRPAIPGHIHKLKIDRTDKTYGLILIKSCELEKLSDLTDEEAHREGFNNKQHYLNYFKHLNNNIQDNEFIWRIEFELLQGDNMNVEDMNEREFLEFLTKLEDEIDKKCGPLDWIDLTAYYPDYTVSWSWSNTNLDQTDAQFFDQCRQVKKLIQNKDSSYRVDMICFEHECVEHIDGSIQVIDAEVTIKARFDGGELYKDQ